MGEMVYLCRLSGTELKHTIKNVSHDITETPMTLQRMKSISNKNQRGKEVLVVLICPEVRNRKIKTEQKHRKGDSEIDNDWKCYRIGERQDSLGFNIQGKLDEDLCL